MRIDPLKTEVELKAISNPAFDLTEEDEKPKNPAEFHIDYQLQPHTQPHTQPQPTEQLLLDHNFRFGWGRICGGSLQRFNKPLYFLMCSAFAVASQGT